MRREIKVGTVSWINETPNPMFSTLQAAALSPDWIPKTYLGLSATSNHAPPDSLTDFKKYQQNRDFRALTFCHFSIEVDDNTGQLKSFSVIDAFHDPGWTPAFRVRNWPTSALSFDLSIYDFHAYQGEASSLSVVNTQARHRNSAIGTVPNDEVVLVNSLIKFRAGQHTDNIGVSDVGAPFHVPWVWCEMLLTLAKGKLKMYGRGSIFPSHAWYLNDTRVTTVAQTADNSFPTEVLTPPFGYPGMPMVVMPTFRIAASMLAIYPVLATGAPSWGPQQPLSEESTRTGAVDGHPYTVSGLSTWSREL